MRNAPLLLLAGLLLALGAVSYLVLDGGDEPAPDPGIGTALAGVTEQRPERSTDLDGVVGGLDEDGSTAERSAVDGLELPATAALDDAEEDLSERPEIRGRVVDGSGLPLAGARVLAAGEDGLPMDLELDANTGWGRRWNTITGPDGRFVLRGPEAGGLRLGVRLAGYAPLDAEGLNLPAGEGADVGDLVVEDSVLLEGRVLAAGGGPVEGAELFAERTTGTYGIFFGSGLPLRPVAVTDDRGVFRVDMLAAGPWKLRVESEGHPDRTFEGRTERPGERQAGLEFLLEPGATIAGRVKGIPDGQGAGLVVRATSKQRQGFAPVGDSREAEVAADGSFVVEGCEPGQGYSLQARIVEEDAPLWGGGRKTRSVAQDVLAGQSGIVLEWTGTTGLAFQVVDAAGRPLENIRVSYGAGYQRQHRDPDGDEIEHYPGGNVLLEELSRDSWNDEPFLVQVRAVGYELLEREVELEEGLVQELGTLALAPAPVLLVRVLDDLTGQPVEDARVRLSVGSESGNDVFLGGIGYAAPTPPGEELQVHSGRSDAEGLARVTSFPGRTASLRVSHPDHTPYELETLVLPASGGAEHEVRLEVGGSVRVLVLDAFGEPAPGVRVEERLQPEATADAGDSMRVMRSVSFGGGGPGEVTDGEGVVLFEHLTPGTHEFRLSSMRGGGGMVVFTGNQAGEPEAWTPVEVTEGGAAEVTLRQEPTASLTGRVLEAGEPLAGATVSLSPGLEAESRPRFDNFMIPGMAGPNSATTDGRGNFRIEGVEPGSYTLSVTHSSRVMPARFDQELVVGENRRDVDLPVAIVEGRVTRPDGSPIEGVDVEVRRATGGASSSYRAMMFMSMDGDASISVGDRAADPTVTGPDGRYRLRGVETGVQLVVEADFDEAVPARSEPLELEDGQLLGDVDLVLEPAGALEVEVVDLDQDSFPMITIKRVLEDGTEEQATTGFAPTGKETFGGLTPGLYKVEVQLMGAGGSADRAPAQVEVQAGVTTPVRILP